MQDPEVSVSSAHTWEIKGKERVANGATNKSKMEKDQN